MKIISVLVFGAAVSVSSLVHATPESEAERDFVSQPKPDYDALYWQSHPELAQKRGIKQGQPVNGIPAYRSR